MTALSKQTEVIQFETTVYKNIVQQTQLAVALEKIEFLLRFVPHLREHAEEYEIKKNETQFVKQEYTRGY